MAGINLGDVAMLERKRSAEEYFTLAAQNIDSQRDPGLYNLSKGLLQLAKEIQQLDAKIVHLSQQVGPRYS
jgi:ribosomal protein L7Ae-like RNA K-turn-binding protein